MREATESVKSGTPPSAYASGEGAGRRGSKRGRLRIAERKQSGKDSAVMKRLPPRTRPPATGADQNITIFETKDQVEKRRGSLAEMITLFAK